MFLLAETNTLIIRCFVWPIYFSRIESKIKHYKNVVPTTTSRFTLYFSNNCYKNKTNLVLDIYCN